MKRVYPFFALVVLAAAASFGLSSWNHRDQPLPRPCSLESLSGYLSLNSEQRHKVEPMFGQFTKRRAEVVNQRDEAVRHLVAVLKSDDGTMQQVDQALKAVDDAQSRMRRLTARHLARLKTVLTKEQKEKLFDLVEQRLCVSDHQGYSTDKQ